MIFMDSRQQYHSKGPSPGRRTMVSVQANFPISGRLEGNHT